MVDKVAVGQVFVFSTLSLPPSLEVDKCSIAILLPSSGQATNSSQFAVPLKGDDVIAL
jgi:hypothetical protein